jgi:hypothetical protein
MLLFTEICVNIFEFLKIDQIYNVRLTCRLFNDIFNNISYDPLKILKRISRRGSTSNILIQTLKQFKDLIDFDVFIKRFLLLNDIELLKTFIKYYKEFNELFCNHDLSFPGYIDTTKYFNSQSMEIIIYYKLSNDSVTLKENLYRDEDILLSLLYRNVNIPNFSIQICVEKSYYKVIDYLLNEKLNIDLLDNLYTIKFYLIFKNLKNRTYIDLIINHNKQYLIFMLLTFCIQNEDESLIRYFKNINYKEIFTQFIINELWFKEEIFKSKKSIMISQELRLETLFFNPDKILNKYKKKLN